MAGLTTAAEIRSKGRVAGACAAVVPRARPATKRETVVPSARRKPCTRSARKPPRTTRCRMPCSSAPPKIAWQDRMPARPASHRGPPPSCSYGERVRPSRPRRARPRTCLYIGTGISRFAEPTCLARQGGKDLPEQVGCRARARTLCDSDKSVEAVSDEAEVRLAPQRMAALEREPPRRGGRRRRRLRRPPAFQLDSEEGAGADAPYRRGAAVSALAENGSRRTYTSTVDVDCRRLRRTSTGDVVAVTP